MHYLLVCEGEPGDEATFNVCNIQYYTNIIVAMSMQHYSYYNKPVDRAPARTSAMQGIHGKGRGKDRRDPRPRAGSNGGSRF